MIEINYGVEVNNAMELENMKVTELKEMARGMQIKGWRTMRKNELMEAIKNDQQTELTTETEEAQIVSETVENDDNINTQTEDKIVPEVDTVVTDEPVTRKNKKRLLEYNGKTQTLTAWANELGIRHQTLYNRIVMKGMDIAKAFEMPVKKA